MSGEDRDRASGRPPKPEGSAGQEPGLGPVLAVFRRWAAAVAVVVPLIAAVFALEQPYARTGTALVAATSATLAAGALVLFVSALLYIYRKTRIRVQPWMAALIAVLLLIVGGGIGEVLAAKPKQPATVPVATASTPSPHDTTPTPGTTSCPPASAVASAAAGLASNAQSTQLSAVSTLRQTMTDSPSEQCTVINVLTTFIRKQSPISNNYTPVTPVVQAALTALADRDPAHDAGQIIDLHDTNLAAANLANANLANADLSGTNGADLTDANLTGANLSGANLANAYLGGANISNTNLTGAALTDASLYGTPLCSASNVPLHPSEGYNCTQ